MRRAHILALVLCVAPAIRAAPLTLDEAFELARRAQPRLRAADADVAAARAHVGRAFAAYLPNLSVSAQSRWDGSSSAPHVVADPRTGAPITSYPFVNGLRYTVSGSIDERLFDFGRTSGAVAAARAADLQSNLDRVSLDLDVQLSVFEAFTDALKGGALERVQALGVEQFERQLRRARALYKSTLRPEIDVLAADTQLAQAQIRLLQAQNGSLGALVQLRAAIGGAQPIALPLAEVLLRELPFERAPAMALEDDALVNRSEPRAAEAQAAAARAAIVVVRGDYYPIFSVGANASVTGTDANAGPFFNLFANFTVSEPLFTGWSTRRGVEEARANAEQARLNVEVTRNQVRQQVAAARLSVELAAASFAVAEKARAQAERQLKLAEIRYDTKVSGFVELNDARNGLVTALAQEVEARFSLSKSRGQLLRRLGRSIAAFTPGAR